MERFENATVSASCGRVEFTENAIFWKRSPEWKDLKTQQYWLRVDGLNSLKTQSFENVWSCDLSPSPVEMENIDRERIVVFIGISLLLSLIVNWQLNVYAHKLK